MSSWFSLLPTYPVSESYAAFLASDKQSPLLIEAEPGAGKSTLVPLWVLHACLQDEREGTIYLVQPRILAAQALAKRLAALTQSECGELVGFQVPHHNQTSRATRLIVTTPGMLLQKVLANPELQDVACVILDEIHERSVNQDMLFAILQEAQLLADFLQLLLMTATPDPRLRQAIEQRLYAPGQRFPVDIEYAPLEVNATARGFDRDFLPKAIVQQLKSCGDVHTQTVLVFLPGWSSIQACFDLISAELSSLQVLRLHSQVDAREQARALDTASGSRIILSTNIAETSLTIADVTLVIDSGLMRRQVFEQKTGISKLRTGRISQASADQRAGRAGRVQAGRCIRLWGRDDRLAAADLPELRATDYLPIALKLAHWGAPPLSLPWLEIPNVFALEFANEQLQLWGFLDAEGAIAQAGIEASRLGTHPRIAALLLQCKKADCPSSLLRIAAALHFDFSEVMPAQEWLGVVAREFSRNRLWQQQVQRWCSQLAQNPLVDKSELDLSEHDAQLIAEAFIDRLGVRVAQGRYAMRNDATFLCNDQGEYAVALSIVAQKDQLSATAISVSLNTEMIEKLSRTERKPIFKNGAWYWQVRVMLGAKTIRESTEIGDVAIVSRVAQQLQNDLHNQLAQYHLVDLLPAAAKKLLGKSRLLQQRELIVGPQLDDEHLVATFTQWVEPFLTLATPPNQLPWLAALEFYLGYDLLQQVQLLLPDALTLPSGRQVSVEFNEVGEVCVAAKLQEFFGCEELRFADGKLPVKISLLSPNGSPLAVTANLKTFWQNAYADVRKDMRGRYPRHPWPENPLEHEATALTKRKLQQRDQS